MKTRSSIKNGNKVQRRRLLPRVRHYNDNSTRVAWIDNRSRKIIRHPCYCSDHISPQCQLHLYPLDTVVKNYEVINPEERSIVPDTSYKNAKAYVPIKETNNATIEQSRNAEPKHW